VRRRGKKRFAFFGVGLLGAVETFVVVVARALETRKKTRRGPRLASSSRAETFARVRNGDERLQEPAARRQHLEPGAGLSGADARRRHVAERRGQAVALGSASRGRGGGGGGRAGAGAGIQSAGRGVVPPAKQVREVAQRRRRRVRGDELGRKVQQGFQRGGRVSSGDGIDVRQRRADVQDEPFSERGRAPLPERGQHAVFQRGARGDAHDLLAVHQSLRGLLHHRRRRPLHRLGVRLQELAHALERVLAHLLRVVRGLIEQLGHRQAPVRQRLALALRPDRLAGQVDALRANSRVRDIRLLLNLLPHLLLGADEVDASALAVVHALGLLAHRGGGAATGRRRARSPPPRRL
jgi:hypothetical protein